MTKILTILLLISVVVYAHTTTVNVSGNEATKSIAGWKTFNGTNSGTNYSIQYPPDWELDKSGKLGSTFFLFSPIENDADQFKENINLLIQDLRGSDITLDKFVEISEGEVKAMGAKATLLESKRMKNTSLEFHKMLYSAEQGQGMYRLQFEQYYWVIKERAYILTLTCEESKFSEYKERGEKILNSFSFKKRK